MSIHEQFLNAGFVSFCCGHLKIHLLEKSFRKVYIRIYVGQKCIRTPDGKLKMHREKQKYMRK